MLGMSPSKAIRATAWTRTTSSQVGPGRDSATEEDRCAHVDEGERDELGEATGPVLDGSRMTSRWSAHEPAPSM